MPTYRYEAHDKFARPAHGKVDAPSEEAAAQVIREDKKLFATRIELDSAEPMKTLFERLPSETTEVRPYEPDPRATEAMYRNQVPGRPPADQQQERRVEHQLPEGADDTVVVRRPGSFAEAQARAASAGLGDWRDELGADLEGLSSALREIDLWKQSSLKKGYKGPKVGKKTWAMIDKALPKVVEAVLVDAVKGAAHNHRA